MARHINSLSDQTLAELKREMQQLRNDTSNLRRHLAHVGARHREAVWVAGGTDVVGYQEGYLVKPAGYTDGANEFSDTGGSSYRGALAYSSHVGLESAVGITHDNTVLYPYIDGNFTATKAGLFLCILSLRVGYDFGATATNGTRATFTLAPFRRSDGTSYENNTAKLNWFVMYHSSYTWTPDYTTQTINYVIPMQIGDTMGLRCSSGSVDYRAEVSQSNLQITRIADEYEDVFGWH